MLFNLCLVFVHNIDKLNADKFVLVPVNLNRPSDVGKMTLLRKMHIILKLKILQIK